MPSLCVSFLLPCLVCLWVVCQQPLDGAHLFSNFAHFFLPVAWGHGYSSWLYWQGFRHAYCWHLSSPFYPRDEGWLLPCDSSCLTKRRVTRTRSFNLTKQSSSQWPETMAIAITLLLLSNEILPFAAFAPAYLCRLMRLLTTHEESWERYW